VVTAVNVVLLEDRILVLADAGLLRLGLRFRLGLRLRLGLGFRLGLRLGFRLRFGLGLRLRLGRRLNDDGSLGSGGRLGLGLGLGSGGGLDPDRLGLRDDDGGPLDEGTGGGLLTSGDGDSDKLDDPFGLESALVDAHGTGKSQGGAGDAEEERSLHFDR
jgi:hypothetical protein